MFKENIKIGSYFTTLPRNVYIPVVKFRTCNYELPIETGTMLLLMRESVLFATKIVLQQKIIFLSGSNRRYVIG